MDRILGYAIAGMIGFAALAVIYVVAPILIPLVLVTAALGLLVWGITSLARVLERHIHGDDPGNF